MTTAAPHPLMTPGEVAQTFRVTPPTVRQWVEAGVLERHLTSAGHARYRREEVKQLWRVSVPFGSPLMSPQQTRQMLDVSDTVLRSWEEEWALEYLRLPAGQRRYVRDQVTDLHAALKGGSDEVMTTAQVAELLDVCSSTVYTWVARKALSPLPPPVRRREHLFAAADVRAFQRARAEGSWASVPA